MDQKARDAGAWVQSTLSTSVYAAKEQTNKPQDLMVGTLFLPLRSHSAAYRLAYPSPSAQNVDIWNRMVMSTSGCPTHAKSAKKKILRPEREGIHRKILDLIKQVQKCNESSQLAIYNNNRVNRKYPIECAWNKLCKPPFPG